MFSSKKTFRLIGYRLDSKEKIRSIEYVVYENDDKLYMYSGLVNGKKTVSSYRCRAKNIGRKNETTPFEQCMKEAISRYEKKLREGYFKTIEELKKNEVHKPMLAYKLNKKTVLSFFNKKETENSTIDFFLQPKYDGVRIFAEINNTSKKLYTRTLKEVKTCDHVSRDLPHLNKIQTTLNESLNMTDDKYGIDKIYIDGELYIEKESFQTIVSAVKKSSETTKLLKYYVYDLHVPNEKIPYDLRYQLLKKLFGPNGICKSENIVVVETLKTTVSKNDINQFFNKIEEYHEHCLNRGYEGIMVRRGNSYYQCNKRTKDLLKYKKFRDEAFKIVDVVSNEKREDHGNIICETINKNGDRTLFACNMKMNHKERIELLKNRKQYIGAIAEVRYFEKTDDGIPRFPVCYGIRIDKDEPDNSL